MHFDNTDQLEKLLSIVPALDANEWEQLQLDMESVIKGRLPEEEFWNTWKEYVEDEE
jgi:hypothetical protein